MKNSIVKKLIVIKENVNYFFSMAFVFAVVSLPSLQAQSTGFAKLKTGLSQVTTDVKGVYDSVVNVIYIVASILLIFALVNVISKFANGDQGASKSAFLWGGALLVLFGGATIIKLTLAA